MTYRTPFAAAVAASVALAFAGEARADDKAACVDASAQAQTLRDAHKLVAAREQARRCARQECPRVVQKDCAAWLEAIEQSLPTVVVTAKDGAGRDLFDVKVAVDGQPFLAKLQGDSSPIDPGQHTLHFETADGVVLDQSVLVTEGARNQPVAVVLGRPAAPPPAAAPAPGPASPEPAPVTPEPAHGPWTTVGWVAGGAGVVALGVGAVFGVLAISDKNGAHCDDTAKVCDSGPLSDARTAATVSTIGLVAGGVLVAGGAGLLLFGPRGEQTATLRLAPAVGARDAGLMLGGSW